MAEPAEAEVLDGTADEASHELVPHQPATLFRTDDPVEVLERASRVATALKSVIVQQNLFKVINDKPHVFVEAWTTCGAMLGLTAYTVWSRPLGERGEHGYDWEARVEVRTLDGRTLSAAEAMCSRKEGKWAKRDDYAVRSMAQTRATSKALRIPLGFIVTLAGYSATPAEEMPEQSDVTPPNPTQAKPAQIGKDEAASLLLNADSAGVGREALRKATQHTTSKVYDGFSDAVALEALSEISPEQLMRLGNWVERKRAEKTSEGTAA